jgi:hypothetical protein
MRASQHYITPDSSPRTRLNGFEKGDKSKTGFWLGGNRDLGVLRHAPGHYFFDGQVDETALTTSFWRETRIMTDV